MKLVNIFETTDQEDDDFAPSSPLARWRANDEVSTVLRLRIERDRTKLSELCTKYEGTIAFTAGEALKAIKQGLVNGWGDFEHISAPIGSFYLVKGRPESRKLAKLFKNLQDDEDRCKGQPAAKLKLLDAAASEHIATSKLTFEPRVIQQHELHEGIIYFADRKRKWLHNPAVWGDGQKYAGSPQHYDWKGSLRKPYFLITDWLQEQAMTMFEKVFAATDEGAPWVVAVAAHHGVVWEVRHRRSHLYIYGEENPLTETDLMNQFSMHKLINTVANINYCKQSFDETGRLIKPAQA